MSFSKRYKYRDVFSRIYHFRFRKRWFEVSGESMAPTLHHGQLVILDTTYYTLDHHYVQRGDIVAFKNPYNLHEILVKRVIGLPKENICIESKHILINDLPLKDFSIDNNISFIPTPVSWSLEAHEYFLLGDNLADSLDSRRLGAINFQYILGIIWLRLWPPKLL